MPTAQLTVAHFLDHGIVAAPPLPTSATAAFTSTDDAFASATPARTASETMTMTMVAAKKVKIVKVDSVLGSLINTAKNPLELATALIKARYESLGAQNGFLGSPTNAVTVCPDGVGYYRHYKGGSIYWSPSTGAHEVHGLIRQKWAELGWERSFLGYPRTNETVGKDPKGEGRFNHFQGGSVYYHPQSGTFEVHGAILAKYLELGAEASVLGYPTTDETKTPDSIGRYNHFQRGSIYWTPSTWAHEVHGLIRAEWAAKGWERNPALGYPLTDELVPHRSIGYTPAPWVVKPIDLPFDVLKLPKEEPSPTIKIVKVTETTAPISTKTSTRVSTKATTRTLATPAQPATVARAASVSSAKSTAKLAAASSVKSADAKSTVTAVTAVKLGTTAELVARPTLTIDPSIFINDHKGRSDDRFADFENGVLFWQRRTNKVLTLTPRTKTPSGTKCAFTGDEIRALGIARLNAALALPAGSIAGTLYGTTGYSWDGAGLHNRAHRLRVMIGGKRAGTNAAILGIFECRLEIAFDPVDREIVGYLTSWSIVTNPGDFTFGNLTRFLPSRLDPVMWKQFSVAKLPATKDNPIAILSVKTHTDGRVSVYFEP